MAEDHLSRKVSRKRTRNQHHDIDLPQKKHHLQLSPHDKETINAIAVKTSLPSGVNTSPAKVAAKTWFSSSFLNERSEKVAGHSKARPSQRRSPTTDVWLGKKASGVVNDNEDIFIDLSSTSTPRSIRSGAGGKHPHQRCPAISQDLYSASNSSSDIFNESDDQFDIDAIGKLEDEYFSQKSVKTPSQIQNETDLSKEPNKHINPAVAAQNNINHGVAALKCDVGKRLEKTDSCVSGSRKSSCAVGSSSEKVEKPNVGPASDGIRPTLAYCGKNQHRNFSIPNEAARKEPSTEIHVQFPSKRNNDVPVVQTDQICDKPGRFTSSENTTDIARNLNRTKCVSGQDCLDFDLAGCFSEEFITGAPNLTVTDDSNLNSETLCRDTIRPNEVKSVIALKNVRGDQPNLNLKSKLNSEFNDIVASADKIKKNDFSVKPDVSRIVDNCQVAPMRAPSLKDKLRQRLQENAQKSTPQNLRLQNLRRESLELAKREAEKIQSEGTEYDIGPFYGLPSKVRGLFEKLRGISKFYDWQHECLTLESVRRGKNLLYSLPTSGGKTLVAEILILQSLLCKKKDALLILPFISVVQEKVRNLAAFGVELNFLVEEYAGSKGIFPPKKRRARKSIYICTIEKSRTLISSLIEAGRIEEIGLVVVDELHMLGEGGGRGACLELTLAKVMYASPSVQIIGMSATLNNIEDLQKFLKAELYTNDFRPVALTEHVKFEDKLYEVKPMSDPSEDRLHLARILTFPYSKEMLKNDPDLLLGLVMEVIPDHSCLIFCPTKKNCENVAKMLCKMMPRDLMQVKTAEKKLLLKTLTDDNNGQICPVLFRTIPYGVAYHHSGLTMDERKGIEEAYSDGTLCMLTCTSTLAAGVNLPAKRVILRSPYVGPKFLSRSQYKQMIGRAGRAGIDTSGESVLVMKSTDLKKVKELIDGPFEKCCSSLLYQDDKGIRALMLSIIGLKLANTSAKAIDFLNMTLFAVQSKDLKRDITQTTQNALQQLLELQLIKQVKNDDGLPLLEVTPLGRATFKSGVDFSRAQQLHTDLLQAGDSLVVANYLHLLYLATPYDMVDQVYVSWKIYMDEFTRLGPSEVKVANQLGITDSHITKKVSGQVIRKAVDTFVVSRFYLTLMLYDLWNQQSIWDVAAKYLQPRGFIQNLLTGAATFAACIKHFCQEIDEFWAYRDLLGNFVKKLSFCVSSELIPLMEVPGVKQARAKQLHEAGYVTVAQLAHADPEKLVKEVEHMPRKAAKSIIASAKMLLKDMVESLKDEVEDLIAMPNSVDANMDLDTRWFEEDLSFEKG